MTDLAPPPPLAEMVADLIDEMVADLIERVEDGYVLTKQEALSSLLQLQKDRAKMRALAERQGNTLQ